MLNKLKDKLFNKKTDDNYSKVRVEVYSQNNRFLTRGRIISRPAESAIVISNDLMALRDSNRNVKLTIMAPSKEPFFVLALATSWNEDKCYFEDLHLVQQGDRRGFFRVKTSDYGHIMVEEVETPITLVDISLAGACILCPMELEVNGHFPIKVNLEETILEMNCCVVRKIEGDMYGVRFLDVDEEQIALLYSAILKIQRKMIQKQKTYNM